jgi:hypothetical protein
MKVVCLRKRTDSKNDEKDDQEVNWSPILIEEIDQLVFRCVKFLGLKIKIEE